MTYAAGIDLGGSSVKSIAITPDGKFLEQSNVPFSSDLHMDWSNTITGVIASFTKNHGSKPAHIAVSAPGLAALDHSAIVNMPGRLEGLVGLDWKAFLGHDRPIPVVNDAHSALLGEAWLGAGKGRVHLVLLTLGTGVGGAAMINGELLLGRSGRGGHFGHASLDPNGTPDICGCPGSLEAQMGNYSIGDRSNGKFPTTHAMVDAYLAGDSYAAEVWLKSVKALAAGVVSFINITDPEAVIIGGGIARAGKALFEPLREMLDQMEWRPTGYVTEILPAELGEFAGAYGAAKFALDKG